MAHVTLPSADQAPVESRALLQELLAAFKRIPNIFAAMAHSPQLLEGILKVDAATTAALPAVYRELAYIRTSAINGCEY